MMEYDLPLFEVYRRLREEAGFQLNINDYKALLQALKHGYGIESIDSLQFLCSTLWVKSRDAQPVFESIFREEFSYLNSDVLSSNTSVSRKGTLLSWPAKNESKKLYYFPTKLFVFIFCLFGLFWLVPSSNKWLETLIFGENFFIDRSDLTSLATSPELASRERTRLNIPQGSLGSSREEASFREGNDEKSSIEDQSVERRVGNKEPFTILRIVLFAKESRLVLQFLFLSVLLTVVYIFVYILSNKIKKLKSLEASDHVNYFNSLDSDREDINYSTRNTFRRTILSGRYSFTINDRQMRQIWRQIRYSQRSSSRGEIDLETTVQRVGERGFFSNPEYTHGRGNRAEIIFLIDRNGSMTAFHEICDRLVLTASSGSYIENVRTFYFRNWPTKFLYKDPFHQNYVSPDVALSVDRSQYCFVIVIGDAGALKTGVNKARLENTVEFLGIVRSNTKHYVWLNPMPRSRWDKSTAIEIAQSIPMFPISKIGLRSAVKELCLH